MGIGICKQQSDSSRTDAYNFDFSVQFNIDQHQQISTYLCINMFFANVLYTDFMQIKCDCGNKCETHTGQL